MDNRGVESLNQTSNLMESIHFTDTYGQNLWSLSLTVFHNSSNTTSANDSETADHWNGSFPQEFPPIFNVTQVTPLEYAMVMYGYIMPFLLILTMVANILIVLVLSQRHMKTPTNLVLMSMAIADMLTLVFPSPWYFYMYTLGYHKYILHPPIACYIYNSMTEIIPMFFHTASIWLTILLAGQRYIYICHPVLAKTWCTIPHVSRATIAIFILAFLAQLSRFFDSNYHSVEFELNGTQQMGCAQVMAEWTFNIQNIYFPLYYGFRILFVID